MLGYSSSHACTDATTTHALDSRAGGGAPAMECQLSTLATCGFGVRTSLEAHWRLLAKLHSFSRYSRENLNPLTCLPLMLRLSSPCVNTQPLHLQLLAIRGAQSIRFEWPTQGIHSACHQNAEILESVFLIPLNHTAFLLSCKSAVVQFCIYNSFDTTSYMHHQAPHLFACKGLCACTHKQDCAFHFAGCN